MGAEEGGMASQSSSPPFAAVAEAPVAVNLQLLCELPAAGNSSRACRAREGRRAHTRRRRKQGQTCSATICRYPGNPKVRLRAGSGHTGLLFSDGGVRWQCACMLLRAAEAGHSDVSDQGLQRQSDKECYGVGREDDTRLCAPQRAISAQNQAHL